MVVPTLTGRKRIFISTPTAVLVDLLSWRFARLSQLPPLQRLSESSSTGTLHIPRNHLHKIVSRMSKHCNGPASQPFRSNVVTPLHTTFNPARPTPIHPTGPNQKPNSIHNKKITAALDKTEDHLLLSLVSRLSDARFHAISGSELDYMKKSQYRYTLPIAVDWWSFDQNPVARVHDMIYSVARDQRPPPPEFSRVLVFHRGIGVDRSHGFFYSEKVDVLTSRALHAMGRRIVEAVSNTNTAVKNWFQQRASILAKVTKSTAALAVKAMPEQLRTVSSELSNEGVQRVQDMLNGVNHTRPNVLPSGASLIAASEAVSEALGTKENGLLGRLGNQGSSSEHKSPSDVKRVEQAVKQQQSGLNLVHGRKDGRLYSDIVLERAVEARWALTDLKLNSVRGLLGRITLQEPSFREVIVVYRNMYPDRPSPELLLNNSPQHNNNNTQYKSTPTAARPHARANRNTSHITDTNSTPREQKRDHPHIHPMDRVRELAPNDRNLCVDVYRDVPMSDVEMLFPHKKVSMRMTDKIWLVLAGVVTVSSALPLLDPSTHLTAGWIAALVALISYQFRVVSRSYLTWTYYKSLSGSLVSDKLLASGAPAAEWVNFEAADQSVKEMVITYVAMCELEHAERAAGSARMTSSSRTSSSAQHTNEKNADEGDKISTRAFMFHAEQVNGQAMVIAQTLCGAHHNFFQALPNMIRLEELQLVKRCSHPVDNASTAQDGPVYEYFALTHNCI